MVARSIATVVAAIALLAVSCSQSLDAQEQLAADVNGWLHDNRDALIEAAVDLEAPLVELDATTDRTSVQAACDQWLRESLTPLRQREIEGLYGSAPDDRLGELMTDVARTARSALELCADGRWGDVGGATRAVDVALERVRERTATLEDAAGL